MINPIYLHLSNTKLKTSNFTNPFIRKGMFDRHEENRSIILIVNGEVNRWQIDLTDGLLFLRKNGVFVMPSLRLLCSFYTQFKPSARLSRVNDGG